MVWKKKNPLELASFHLFVESVLTSGINSWLGRAAEAERNRVGGTITAATKLHQSEQITKICSNLGQSTKQRTFHQIRGANCFTCA